MNRLNTILGHPISLATSGAILGITHELTQRDNIILYMIDDGYLRRAIVYGSTCPITGACCSLLVGTLILLRYRSIISMTGIGYAAYRLGYTMISR